MREGYRQQDAGGCDQPVAGGAHGEVAADADQEQDCSEDDGEADVLVGSAGRRLALLELGVSLPVECLPADLLRERVLRQV